VKLQLENLVQTPIPTKHGEFILHYFSNNVDDKEHVALVKGDVAGKRNVPVRIHSECFTGDVLGSRRCDCGEQLDLALQIINAAGFGILIYLRQEGRGIGLLNKLRAYNLQDQGLDTVDANIELGHLADEREYSIAGLILENLQVSSVELITNNPKKITALEKLGITVEKRIPVEAVVHNDNIDYLKTKAKKMAHLLFQPKPKSREPL
jgi:GTP cyclohydrolase II